MDQEPLSTKSPLNRYQCLSLGLPFILKSSSKSKYWPVGLVLAHGRIGGGCLGAPCVSPQTVN